MTVSPLTHMTTLVEEIGARPAGSPARQRAEAYIRDAFKRTALSVEDIRVAFPDWSLEHAALTVDGDGLPLDPNPFSPSCEVTAPVVPVSTLPELEAADLSGKIALLYGELSKAPIFPINFAPVQFERDQAINRLLIEKAPLAVLAVNLHPWRRQHIFEDEDFPLPSATIPLEAGRRLLAHAGQTAHLRLDTTTTASYVTTLIARPTATNSRRIVLCAHYDTKVGTPGAFDNGAGVATLLTLAERLPALGLPIGLEFVAFADEEYGAHTDEAYVARFGDAFDDILCAINIDGVGLLAENTTVTTLAHSEGFEQAVREVAARFQAVVWAEPWIQSNHATFAMRGVPCVALTSLTWERAHQASDTTDWVDPAKLDETVELVTDIVRAIHAQAPGWARPAG